MTISKEPGTEPDEQTSLLGDSNESGSESYVETIYNVPIPLENKVGRFEFNEFCK